MKAGLSGLSSFLLFREDGLVWVLPTVKEGKAPPGKFMLTSLTFRKQGVDQQHSGNAEGAKERTHFDHPSNSQHPVQLLRWESALTTREMSSTT